MKISRKLELLPQGLFIDVEYKSRKWGSSYYFNSIDTPFPNQQNISMATVQGVMGV